VNYKTCSTCKKVLPMTTNYFFKDKQYACGFRSQCKHCVATQRKQYMKNYRLENKEKLKGYYTKFKELHKEELENYMKSYHKNREETLTRNKYTQEEQEIQRKEKLLVQRKIYRESHKAQITKYRKQYNKEHKDIRLFQKQRNVARKTGTEATLTLKQWENSKEYFNNKCAYCGRELPLQIDHFVPLASKGNLVASNIIPSCIHCNSSKQNKEFFKWYSTFKYYSKEREKIILEYLASVKEI